MVVKIEKSRASSVPSLDYNEKKVLAGEAVLVGYANMDDIKPDSVYSTFERLERGGLKRVKNASFHMSINPGIDDAITEQEVLALTCDIMNELGLGEQPFLIYRHEDIERHHYHVVSSRIRPDGHWIDASFERRKLQSLLKSVQKQYHFTLGKGKSVTASEDLGQETDAAKKQSSRFVRIPRFDPRKANYEEQCKTITDLCMEQYHFTSLEQYLMVLETYGLKGHHFDRGDTEHILFHGLTAKGRETGKAISFDKDFCARVYAKADVNKAQHHRWKAEKTRIQSLTDSAFKYARSESHFENILANKGITTFLSRVDGKADGDIFGITFVDAKTRSVFKASELKSLVSVQSINDKVASGEWREMDRGEARPKTFVARARKTAMAEAIRMRNDPNSSVAVLLAMSRTEKPQNTIWSGRVPKSEEEKAEERRHKATAMKETLHETLIENLNITIGG